MSRDPTCEERIAEHMESRLADFRSLNALIGVWDDDSLREVLEDENTRSMYEEIKPSNFEEITGGNYDELNEAARTRIEEYPLGVSANTVFRVELSTGGPGDWLEVFCWGDTPRYEVGGEPYEAERIVYHFNDWFDHAERELHDKDFNAALAFVSQVVPELME